MDERLEALVGDVQRGALSRRGFLERAGALGLTSGAALALLNEDPAEARGRRPRRPSARNDVVAPSKWQRGRGWGWVWGSDDEVGALNELSPALTRKALRYAKDRVYDLGMRYDRRTFKFPGHADGEIVTYRSPQGLLLQRDRPEVVGPGNSLVTTYASCLNSISDNVATQIDGLGHIYEGRDPHAYNDFKAREIVGDYGVVKLGVETIPPIVAPATLIDVAGYLRKDALPAGYAIGADLLRETLAHQKVDVEPLDVVLVRTGTGGIYLKGDLVGANQDELAEHDSAGITLGAARYLVEQKAALMIGSDTSGLEVVPPTEQLSGGTSFNPVHVYLLVRQGVHILEFNNLERLARDNVYKFTYVLTPNKIVGNVAGTVQRPIALA